MEQDNRFVEIRAPVGQDASKLQSTCSDLFNRSEFVDCTLACKDGHVQAHRVVLSSWSQYLYNLFKGSPSPTPCAHPVVLLRKYYAYDVRTVIEFMYVGRIAVEKLKIPTLKDIAEELDCSVLSEAIVAILSRDEIHCRQHNGDQEAGKGMEIVPVILEPPTVVIKKEIISDALDVTSSFSNSMGQVQISSTDRFTNGVNIQYDKGESFVYTNEDFGITVDQRGDSDQNGSEDDELESSAEISGQIEEGFQKWKMEESRTAEASSSCPWCKATFGSINLLQLHIKSHVGTQKPFSCPYCSNNFSRSTHLKRHLRTHTGEKPYQCNVCQRQFARQDKLKSHVERHVQSSGRTVNTASTITSYPPPSVSQSVGGQVPIKVLIPTGSTRSLQR